MEIVKSYSVPVIVTNIKSYPQNGKHQQCSIGLPFDIKKGEDGYFYFDKNGVQKSYNIFKNDDKVDDRWIVHLSRKGTNESLENIFEIKVHKDLDVIVAYCIKIYKKSLEMEIKRIQELLKQY